MKKLILLIMIVAALSTNAQYLIKNVNLITMQDSAILMHQDILLKNGIIAEYHATGVKKYTTKLKVIDGNGAYLMPGFWDMHAHLPVTAESFSDAEYLQLMLNAGVTNVRSMRGDNEEIKLRQQIEKGDMEGPELFISKVLPTEDSILKSDWKAAFFKEYTGKKYDFVKYLGNLDSVQMKEVADLCKAKGIILCGHAFQGSLDKSTAAGFRSVEHYHPLLKKYQENPDAFTSACTDMKNKNLFLSPTFSFYHVFGFQFTSEELNRRNGMNKINEKLRAEWNKEVADMESTQINKAIKDPSKKTDSTTQRLMYEKLKAKNKASLELAMNAIRIADARGVKILLSADDGAFNVPGYSLLEEMKLFSSAGFSNFRIYKMATVYAADFFGKKNYTGTVAKGSVANVCLYEKNPLENLENLKSLKAVFVKGREMKIK